MSCLIFLLVNLETHSFFLTTGNCGCKCRIIPRNMPRSGNKVMDLGIYSSSMLIFICLLTLAWYTALGMAGENGKVLFLSLGDCILT